MAVQTKAQLLDERRRSALESVRRDLCDYYLVGRESPQLVEALADLERERRTWHQVVKKHVAEGVSFDDLAATWRISNKTVNAEWWAALRYLACRLGRLAESESVSDGRS